MRVRPLSIDGAWEITPKQFPDARGLFLEWYRSDRVAEVVGHPLPLAQANLSVSARDVVRGIHYADVPPGQAKYVTCVSGAVRDVVVDLRRGSPSFGRWEAVTLDDEDHRAVYIAEGLGHGVCALTDHATLAYLCSTPYNPGAERTVDPLDPALGIDWPTGDPILSARDAAAPALAAAQLPDFEACVRHYAAAGRTAGGTPPAS